MGRLKGILNKISTIRPSASNLSTEERIRFIANILIDKIVEDQRNGKVIYKKICFKKYG